jgi:hypothetical protein
MTCLFKKGELKSALSWTEKGPKAADQMKSITDKKERIAYPNSG